MKRDWIEIQNYYNNNHTWRDIKKEFKISDKTLIKAINNDLLKIRTKSEANVVANKKNTKTLSEKTKKKISESRKKYLMENPDKVPYLLNHYSKGESYPEKYFDAIFKDKFEYTKYFRIGLYHIDVAITNKKIAIEIDGDQHYLDKKIVESDKRKNKYLIENGWNIIRIKWSDYQRMNRIDKEKYIIDLIDFINNLISIKPEIIIIEKQNYCECGKKIYKRSKMCIRCTALKQKRKVENRPTIDELKMMVKNSSLEAVGRKYGVTGNSIKKWLKYVSVV